MIFVYTVCVLVVHFCWPAGKSLKWYSFFVSALFLCLYLAMLLNMTDAISGESGVVQLGLEKACALSGCGGGAVHGGHGHGHGFDR